MTAARPPDDGPAPAQGQLPLGSPGTGRRPRSRAAGARAVAPDAATDPVAAVAVDVALPHLDRPFDYRVTADLDDAAVPGARVRVRFAGRDVGGVILSRRAASDHPGRLAALTRVVSPVPVLTPAVAAAVRAVADRYAGTFADVVRAAVPPRHARAEAAVMSAAAPPPSAPDEPTGPGPWSGYQGGEALCDRLAGRVPGPAPRAVWTAAPGEDVEAAVAVLVEHAAVAGRGSLVVVPDGRDAARTAAALSARVDPDAVEILTADLGPSARYRAFLRVLRGDARVVVGTRAAVFAPVGRLGLVVVWDDGDDLLAEPHAPYWHAREVAAIRAEAEGAALVLGAHARSVEAAAAVASGWAREVVAPRPSVRDRAPRVRSAADDDALARDPAGARARLPHVAWDAAREGLARGPVLVQVPRRGYVPALACRRCREPARCRACGGPLGSTSGGAAPACAWCGRPAADWRCPACDERALRAVRVGSARTAEELGRAFPGVPVVTSGGESVVAQVTDRPALVVATPGAEPVAPDGYAAALLLDGDLLLGRADLRASEEAARRWFNAVALVRPRGRGGAVVLVADPGAAAVQAVLRADPGGLAARELADRVAAGLPPAVRAADVSGAAADVDDLIAVLEPPPGLRVLGPTPVTATRSRPTPEGPVRVRALLTVPLAAGDLLCDALKAAAAVRSARKEGGAVVVRVDPVSLD